MNPVWNDVITYGGAIVVALVSNLWGHRTGRKVTIKEVETRLAPVLTALGPDVIALVEKALKGSAAAVVDAVRAPVSVASHAVNAVESRVAESHSTALELVKYALLGLIKVGHNDGVVKHLKDMNDAEKYAIAQFVQGSLPAALKDRVQASDIVNAISTAQSLLDDADNNPLLQKALELTGLAQAFTVTQPATPETAAAADATSSAPAPGTVTGNVAG